ncbi:hypothetical protein ABW20_dc0109679 [Dactylellina cionopaga]|nr:hypothetical protein ABW20_dc0109679 [Dactylellina cionopaga]
MQQATHFTIILLCIFYFAIAAPNTTLVDFSTAPRCAYSSCLKISDSPYKWTSQSLLCPETGNGGQDVTYDCLCNIAPRPLLCQPYDPASDNSCFLSLTKWYADTCETSGYPPLSPVNRLNFFQQPLCARACIQMMTSHLGCPDNSLSCACQLRYLASNSAECIRNNCKGDVQTYIGDLVIFTTKWINQGCGFDDAAAMNDYKNSPAARPQDVLAADFQGKEYTDWQDALDAKRRKMANLGAILPLSLIFGGIFGVMGLQWFLEACGWTSRRSPRVRKFKASVRSGFVRVGDGLRWVGRHIAVGLGFIIIGVKKVIKLF